MSTNSKNNSENPAAAIAHAAVTIEGAPARAGILAPTGSYEPTSAWVGAEFCVVICAIFPHRRRLELHG